MRVNCIYLFLFSLSLSSVHYHRKALICYREGARMEISPKSNFRTTLPGNVRFGSHSYKESDLDTCHPSDRKTILDIISYCATKIVREHIDMKAIVTPHEQVLEGLTFNKFIIYLSFPKNTVITTDRTSEISLISPHFIKTISWVRDENANSLEIPLISAGGPFAIDSSTMIFTKVNHIIINPSYESDLSDNPRPLKRTRKSS